MLTQEKLEELMRVAITEANQAKIEGNNPFGALLIDDDGNIIAKAHNMQVTEDRTAHAEVSLIRKVSREMHVYQLQNYSVVSTSEPCAMCMSLLVKTQIKALYYGARSIELHDPEIHAEEINERSRHKVEIVRGILEKECNELFK